MKYLPSSRSAASDLDYYDAVGRYDEAPQLPRELRACPYVIRWHQGACSLSLPSLAEAQAFVQQHIPPDVPYTISGPEGEDMPACEDCERPTLHIDVTGAYVCPRCQEVRQEAAAERAQERAFARYHGADTPQTLDERHEQAWRQKREWRR